MPTNITERQLEDYICANPSAITGGHTRLTFLARQVSVRHGIIDVILISTRVFVVELKAGPLHEKHVGQLLRYIADVDQILTGMTMNLSTDRIMGREKSAREEEVAERMVRWHSARGILIGTEVSPYVVAACEGANIQAFLWHYADGQFSFKAAPSEAEYPGPPYPDWALRASSMLEQRIRQDVDDEFEQGFRSLLDPTKE